MRLTLRTLLAYMDDILEPADHADLGTKIEASDFASELIHRSRDTVRRLRLGAPAVLSDGSDDVLDSVDLGDANSVAEYLDNTLPPEQVADFERMCLEPGNTPDMHLAEVASCHHVLTMVLGEPAEVDADLKSRMYQLPARLANGQKLRIEPAHVTQPEAQTGNQTEAPPVVLPTAPPLAQPASVIVEPELPDYLREAVASKRRSRRWAIVTTLMALGGLVYWFANPPEAMPPSDLPTGDLAAYDEGALDLDINMDVEMAAPDAPSVESMTSTEAPASESEPFAPDAPDAPDGPFGAIPSTSAPGTVEPPATEPEMPAEIATTEETKTPPPNNRNSNRAANPGLLRQSTRRP